MRKTLLLLTISVILLIACGGGTNTASVGPDSTPFRGGENGLKMEFLDGSPPDEVFDNSNFPFGVVVQLENLGEDDIDVGDGFIRVTGINPVDFGLAGQADLERPIPPMDSTKKNFDGTLIDGDTDNVEFPGLNYQIDLPGNILQPRIRAEACYNYKTRTATLICIKPDLLSKTETKDICDISGDKDPQNSGGPLQITEMKQTAISSGKIQVNFVIEHVGEVNDRFFKIGTDCDDRVTNIDKEKVLVKVTSDVNGAIPRCTGLQDANTAGNEGFITLFDRVPRTVVCEIDISGIDSTFEELFEVDLDYRYFQFIEKSVLIKDVGGSDS
tara:strand:- start:1333 stop:2316 length:984 start_codon:yes stop_codon:yes gene_type:complete